MKATTLRGTAPHASAFGLGVAVAVCFITGLISHLIQHPRPLVLLAIRPIWLYRVTTSLRASPRYR